MRDTDSAGTAAQGNRVTTTPATRRTSSLPPPRALGPGAGGVPTNAPPLRVLHVIPGVAPRYGGPSQAILDMCAALGGAGVHTLVATTDADGAGRLDVPLARETLFRNVPAIFFRRQWSEALKYSRPLERWLVRHVAEFHVVHVHAVFSHACVSAAAACRRAGVPYVVRPLGTLDPWSMRQKPLRKRLMWHLGVKQMLRHAAAIHYTAGGERSAAEASLSLSRGTVIPLGVSHDMLDREPRVGAFRRAHPELGEDPYVLFMSRLHPKKGLEVLLPAFADAVRSGADATVGNLPDSSTTSWRLVVAGEGDPEYLTSLETLAQRCGVRDRVHFTGWLAGDAKTAALDDASLLALTSQQENFGLAVVEAMARKRPVIVSEHVDLAPDIASAGAGWITPLDQAHVASAIRIAIQDPAARRHRGELGHALVRDRFTWEAVGQELVRLYHAVALPR